MSCMRQWPGTTSAPLALVIGFTPKGFEAIHKIERNPKRGVPYGKGYLFQRTDVFPYVIYYQNLDNQVEVIAIAHERRRPGYWRKRLK